MSEVKETVGNKFLANVKAMLKLDDDSKIVKFQATSLKVWNKQIKERRDKIEELNEKIEELTDDTLFETVHNVNVSRIKSTDSRTDYVQVYGNAILKVREEIEDLEDDIESLNNEIEDFEFLIEQVS